MSGFKRWLTLFFLIVCFFTAHSSVWATVYYVDSSVTDTNSSSATPDFTTYNHLTFATTGGSDSVYKTMADVNKKTLSSDDQMLFRKGQTWRAELDYPSSGTSGHPIIYGAFGSGDAPIITASNLITSGWSKQSTKVWKAADTTQPYVVYFNGTRGSLVANAASVVAEYNWYWASNVLYVWSPPDSDPSYITPIPVLKLALGAMFSAPVIKNTLPLIELPYVMVINSSNVNVGSNTVEGIVFQNCTVERGSKHAFDIKGATAATSLTIDRCVIQNTGGSGLFVENQYATATFSNNTITGVGWQSVTNNTEYSGIEGPLDNTNIFGNTIYNIAPSSCKNGGLTGNYCHGIYVGTSNVVSNIYQNTIYSNPAGMGIKTRGSANIYRNNIYSNNSSGIGTGGNGSTDNVVSIYSNLIYGNNLSNGNNGLSEDSKGDGNLSLSIMNNTIYQNSNTGNVELGIDDDLTSLTIKNNIIFTTATRRTISLVAAQTGTVSINNNLHWRADGNPNIYHAGAGVTWADWQALGYDTNGLNSDPLLVNPSTDFNLQGTSPAINTGADLSSIFTTDYAGTTWSVFNIGAYEYIPPPVVSISVSDGVITYGTMVAGSSKTTVNLTDTQTLTNDGNVLETFNIKGQNTACPWTLAATAGTNQYAHEFCKKTDVSCSSPPTNYTAMTTDYQALYTSVVAAGTKQLDLRITVPTTSSCFTQQSADVTIQAVQQ